MERRRKEEENHWESVREEGGGSKALKNKSGIPYNMINLDYKDDEAGQRLRHEDDRIRYRGEVRARNLQAHGGARCGYDILTGAPKPLPPEPSPPRRPSTYK